MSRMHYEGNASSPHWSFSDNWCRRSWAAGLRSFFNNCWDNFSGILSCRWLSLGCLLGIESTKFHSGHCFSLLHLSIFLVFFLLLLFLLFLLYMSLLFKTRVVVKFFYRFFFIWTEMFPTCWSHFFPLFYIPRPVHLFSLSFCSEMTWSN